MKLMAMFFVTIWSLGTFAGTDWKVVAVTQDCGDKVEILAKTGEKYVIAAKGSKQEKLVSSDGTAFAEDGMARTEFKSANYSYTQPSVVEANSPKLEVLHAGKKSQCRMALK